MIRKAILATALTLMFAVGADAAFVNVTTQVTLVAPFGGATNVTGLVNKTGGEGTGLSYTTSSSFAPNTEVQATGAILISSFKTFGGGGGTIQGFSLIETYALQGHQIAPVGGATFSAQFDKGVVALFAVPNGTFNTQQTATWGTGGTVLYSMILQEPPNPTVKGPLGDTGFAGQGLAGQQQASFFASTSVGSIGAFATNTLSNPDLLFAPPQPFDGFQGEIKELNSLANNNSYDTVNFPTNAQLDANYNTLAALDPGLGMDPAMFTTNNYTANAGGTNPNTLQEIGITQYPFQIQVVPEPASIVLLSFGALGLGFHARRQKKKVVLD